MKINEAQVAQLYAFTRQHYVEYYDLQTELVDHLANAIEAQWEENPSLTFEAALQVEFKKFGVFGFMDVVNKRKGALQRKYTTMVWNELKAFFSIPKIIGTVTATGIVFYLLKLYLTGIYLLQGVILVLLLIFFLGLFVLKMKNKRNTTQTGKKWLLQDIIYGYSYGSGFLNLLIQLSLHTYRVHYPDWFLMLFSILLVVLILTEYVVLILIPSKAAYYLRKTYPEYEIIGLL